MADIVKIMIAGESGYGCSDDAYTDKIEITVDSIKYEYKPFRETEMNPMRKWKYKTNSPIFIEAFKQVSRLTQEIIDTDIFCDCTDVGATKFVVTYSDKSKQVKQWFCSGDEFRDCFLAIKQLVPACEDVPCVLITSEDSTEM